MIKTKSDPDKAKKEFEKLDAEISASISELRNCLDSEKGKGVSRRTKEKMSNLDGKIALMKAIKQRIDSETQPGVSVERDESREKPSIQFIDDLSKRMQTLRLCIEGATALESSNDDCYLGLVWAYNDLTKVLKNFLPEKMVVEQY